MKNLIVFFLLIFASTMMAQTDTPIDWRVKKDNKGKNFYEVDQAFKDYWKDKTPSKGQGYSVFRRWENYMKPRVFPSGDMTLPSTTYERYMEWQKNNPAVANRSATSNWTTLGPTMVPTGYDGGAGRVDFIRFDPTDVNTIYVGTPDGGLWKTTNGGTNWTTNTDFLPIIGCSDLAINKDNTQIMYLATGNWESDRSSIGVLKSINGGTSWAATDLVWEASESYEIRRMIMHPNDPSIMIVATDGGVFRTTDGWTNQLGTTLNFNYNIYDIEFHPTDPTIVYAAGKTGLNTNVFWKSTDTGATWTAVSSGLPSSADVSRILIGVSKANATYIYLLAGNAQNGYKGLYRSTNTGTSFTTRSTTPNILESSKDGLEGNKGQANHDLAIVVAPNNAELVTIGGINQWQSTNGGTNWTRITYWLGVDPAYPGEEDDPAPYIHADIQDIVYEPNSNTKLYASCDGGISTSPDGGASWTQITGNLSIAQQTNIAQSATTEGLVVAGLQDIGTIKRDGGTGSWSVINGGDGEAAFIDRTSDLVIVTSNPNGAHDISYDGGATRQTMNLPSAGLLFYSPVSQDPSNADIMYAGGRASFYKNVDFFNAPDTWVTLGSPPSTGDDAAIIRYVVAPSNNQVIYFIKGNEGDPTTLSRSDNGGSTFTNITTGDLATVVANAQMSSITVSNTNPLKAWVTFSGYSDGNKVFRTTNGGSTWTNISTGLPNLPMNTLVYVNGSTTDELYIGGDIGVYFYDNNASAWTLFNTNLPNTHINDLKIFYDGTTPKKLRAATYGRGTWETPINGALPVELISFTGKNKADKNVLTWKTAEEINLDKYEIERSTDNKTFSSIGSISAKPASSDLKTYLFEDLKPSKGINYYRLKMIDENTKFDYSKTVVLFVEDKESTVRLFPNPTTNTIALSGLPDRNTYTIRLMDGLGRRIRTQEISANDQIDVSDFSNGTFFIEIQMGDTNSIVKRFIKE